VKPALILFFLPRSEFTRQLLAVSELLFQMELLLTGFVAPFDHAIDLWAGRWDVAVNDA
jgi:hypothetical protein